MTVENAPVIESGEYGPFTVERFTDDRGKEMVRVTGNETERVGDFPASAFDYIAQQRDIAYACRSALSSEGHSRLSAMDHIFHVWINARNRDRIGSDGWERDLYEWKTAEAEMRRLPTWLRNARQGTLRTTHRYCSHSPVENLKENKVICALGVDVTECPILASFYDLWADERERTLRDGRSSHYAVHTSEDDADEVAARICAWHIFMSKLEKPFLDTSEGYVQDESDRRFWARTYAHMSMTDPDNASETYQHFHPEEVQS